MTSPRTLRRLSRFWRRAFLFALAVQFAVPAIPWLYHKDYVPFLPIAGALALTWICYGRSQHWCNERLAYLSNRKRFRRFAR